MINGRLFIVYYFERFCFSFSDFISLDHEVMDHGPWTMDIEPWNKEEFSFVDWNDS